MRVLPASCYREWPAARPAISCQAEDSFILIEDRDLAALVETSSTYRRRKVVVSKFGSKLRHVWTAPGWQGNRHVALLVGAAVSSAC